MNIEEALELRAKRETEHIEELASALATSQKLVEQLTVQNERLHAVIERFRPKREDWCDNENYERACDHWDSHLEAEGVDHP